MKIYKTSSLVTIESEGSYYQKEIVDWDNFINRKNLYNSINIEISGWPKVLDFKQTDFDAPIGTQEVWAAGVTYLRSKEARMEEAKESGGDYFYDKVYDADRPELFFKATAARTVGHRDTLHIRRDSTWNVPEPELTLFVSSAGTIEAYTIGNDMSSRSIEGENPLYLPQAKTYERCAAIGPCLHVIADPISIDTKIKLDIFRNNKLEFSGHTVLSQMKRTLSELVNYLFRECDFPTGVFLMTGTCIVPPDDFTLHKGDVVDIEIDGIGKLSNTISTK